LLADFAAIIIPQVDAEMKERRKNGLAKGGKMPGAGRGKGKAPLDERTDLSGHVTDAFHPGRRAIMEATAILSLEANQTLC
jgi:hypothetical protein